MKRREMFGALAAARALAQLGHKVTQAVVAQALQPGGSTLVSNRRHECRRCRQECLRHTGFALDSYSEERI